MSSYQYRKFHCGDKTVVRSSYLHNGISYTGKVTSIYWIKAQVLKCACFIFIKKSVQFSVIVYSYDVLNRHHSLLPHRHLRQSRNRLCANGVILKDMGNFIDSKPQHNTGAHNLHGPCDVLHRNASHLFTNTVAFIYGYPLQTWDAHHTVLGLWWGFLYQ